MLTTALTNTQKADVWEAYHGCKPTRVPLRYSTTPRIILLDKKLNTQGYTFEQTMTDAKVHVAVALQYQHYLRTTLNQYCDSPTGLPDEWAIDLYVSSICDAACLGTPIEYPENQVPCTEPTLTEENKHEIFEVDIDHPLECPYVKGMLNLWHEMDQICQTMTYKDRPVRLNPWAILWTDGPVTVACNLRGTDFMIELIEDPDYAQQLLAFLIQAAINRRAAFEAYWGDRIDATNCMADDSCAMLSPDMYRELILPHHRRYYEAGQDVERCIHLCGDATHLFPIIAQELNVTAFDTGFPVDHGKIRQELGPNVQFSGGTQIAILLNSTPNQVFEHTREILTSGIKEGGRFILQEGNNLPPSTPMANLEAMYEACLEFGQYD